MYRHVLTLATRKTKNLGQSWPSKDSKEQNKNLVFLVSVNYKKERYNLKRNYIGIEFPWTREGMISILGKELDREWDMTGYSLNKRWYYHKQIWQAFINLGYHTPANAVGTPKASLDWSKWKQIEETSLVIIWAPMVERYQKSSYRVHFMNKMYIYFDVFSIGMEHGLATT